MDTNIKFPKLIKDNRFWELVVSNIVSNNFINIKTRYGIIGGKVTETKGQKFETFKRSQAMIFAKKKFIDKLRNGYRPVTGNKIKNKQIKKFIKPMGAILLEKNEDKIIFPADAQPKLDGFRGIAIGKNIGKNKVQIVSKNGLPYPHLEKIKKDLETFPLIKQGYHLDGEIYLHNRTLGELRSVLERSLIQKRLFKMKKRLIIVFLMLSWKMFLQKNDWKY